MVEHADLHQAPVGHQPLHHHCEREGVALIVKALEIESWVDAPLPELPTVGSAQPCYELPALRSGPILFAAQEFDPEAAAQEARAYGLWANRQLAERLWPHEERPVRPLMPLRKGHLAVLTAAGFLNNILLEAADRRVLVKGRTTKEFVQVDSGDPDVEIEREVLRTSVVTLDLGTGLFEVVQHGGSRIREERAA